MAADRLLALVVEDDRDIRRAIAGALESGGWLVREAGTLAEGRRFAEALKVSLLVVDLGLPDGDGIALIAGIRRDSDVPVIVLSARSDEAQKVRALDAGADDYVEKPFRVAEFLARVRAQMRRQGHRGGGTGTVVSLVGGIEFDREARVVRRDGEPLHLTPTEYQLFDCLVRNAGRVLTHRQLLREVWGGSRIEQSHHLRVFMASLRRKVEADPTQPALILTETGVGYRLTNGDGG